MTEVSPVALVFRYERGDVRRPTALKAFARIDRYPEASTRQQAAEYVLRRLEQVGPGFVALGSGLTADGLLDSWEDQNVQVAP